MVMTQLCKNRPAMMVTTRNGIIMAQLYRKCVYDYVLFLRMLYGYDSAVREMMGGRYASVIGLPW